VFTRRVKAYFALALLYALSAAVITLHWAIVLVLAPLGTYILLASILATAAYVALLLIVFAGGAGQQEPNR
jgi:hypothetical protein